LRGREGIESYVREVSDTWEEYRVVVQDFRDLAEDRVLVLSRVEGRGAGSGGLVDAAMGQIFDFRDQKIGRVRTYLDHGEALKAAGLEREAMSQQNVELVRVLVERWNSGDRSFRESEEHFDPAIELEGPFSSVIGEPYRGYAGMERWLRDNDEQFSEWRVCIDDVRDRGDRVIAIGTVNARGRVSGVALEFPSATVFDFQSDHRIRRVRIYSQIDEALKAVGLEV
jgi:ketosteroid isomerase-like protein